MQKNIKKGSSSIRPSRGQRSFGEVIKQIMETVSFCDFCEEFAKGCLSHNDCRQTEMSSH